MLQSLPAGKAGNVFAYFWLLGLLLFRLGASPTALGRNPGRFIPQAVIALRGSEIFLT